MSQTSIQLKSLAKGFSGTGRVIEPLDLKIEAGEFVAFLGPSGCGKSTLLRIIAGLEAPDAGEAKVEAKIDASGKKHFRGFVFQDAHLLPWRNVLENAALPLELTGVDAHHARQTAREALTRVGLSDALERFPNQLSGGMKMRVSLARALVTRPSLLLLDEPFAALDENTRHQLQTDLRLLWAEAKMTVVFVTHSVSEAAYLADRAIVFSKRPARVVLNRQSALPWTRSEKLRTDPKYLAEVEAMGAAFRRGEK